ncbi:unnamed protein product, partial [Pylaiella littoralis]
MAVYRFLAFAFYCTLLSMLLCACCSKQLADDVSCGGLVRHTPRTRGPTLQTDTSRHARLKAHKLTRRS